MLERNFQALFALCLILAAILLAVFVFVGDPALDIAISQWFYDPERRSFIGARSTVISNIRETLFFALRLSTVAVLFFWGRSAFVAQRVPAKIWSFIGLSYVLGPGLFVNVLLKGYWGRARPAQTELFGGDKIFTPAFRIADQCEKNCSFVSGEAAGLATLCLLIAILGWRHVRTRKGKILLASTTGGIALLAAVLRVVMGAHFFSDSLFGALFAAMIVVALYILLDVGRLSKQATPTNFLADAIDVLKFRWRNPEP